MYDGTPPLSTTTVFSALDSLYPNTFARITKVDGQETSCWQVGCPMWVRLLPGSHTLEISYKFDFKYLGYAISHKSAKLEMTIPEMLAKHVYQADYFRSGNAVSASYKDLGENPDYGVTLGLKGVNQNYYPVSFE